jgi:hypothetical protein
LHSVVYPPPNVIKITTQRDAIQRDPWDILVRRF